MPVDLCGLLTLVRLSRESEYGLEALRLLARQPQGATMLLHDVARAGELPEMFLAKIFQKLARAGVLLPHRGAIRGYSLARPAGAISLREVLEAIEGPSLFERCPFWPSRCSERRPCCFHSQWAAIRPMLRRTLEETTLEQIARHPRRRGSGPPWPHPSFHG